MNVMIHAIPTTPQHVSRKNLICCTQSAGYSNMQMGQPVHPQLWFNVILLSVNMSASRKQTLTCDGI